MSSHQLKFWIALHRVPGLGRVRFSLLQSYFSGDMESAWNASPSQLQEAGLDRRTISSFSSKRPTIKPELELERLESLQVQAVNWIMPEYPQLLKTIDDLPPLIYLKGNYIPEDQRAVAVVGTRGATAYGREAAYRLAGDLARSGVTVVSGLARGIDATAHRAALEAGGRTVAVMGCGLDIVYPPEHAGLAREIVDQGCLVSEYPLGTRPEAQNFPRRNRIMSGLSLGTLVVEAGPQSGAMHTVNHALGQGREVFVVPGSIFSPVSRGANELIQQGAKLVQSVEDVLEELNLTAVAQEPQPAPLLTWDETEGQILRHLTQEPTHIDDIQHRCGLPIASVSSNLALMEIKGMVRHVGGMSYVLSTGSPVRARSA